MIRKVHFGIPVTVLLAGCLSGGPPTRVVPSNPFQNVPPGPVAQPSYSQASLEAAGRVDGLSRKILAANPQTGERPAFQTVGVPEPEVFHRGTSEVYITEGLVNQCATDGQLAAVLCSELGKLIAERELLAGPQARSPERGPPMEVRVGNDNAGSFGPPDLTRQAELARFEREHHHGTPAGPPPPPDARALARAMLTKTGYPVSDLDAVAPLLKAAEENNSLARQLKGAAGPARPWTSQ